MENIAIRNMITSDFEMMAQWLRTKEVLEFYGNAPFTLEQVREKYEPRVNGEIPVVPYIVEMDCSPIGYMQHYQLDEETKATYGYSSSIHIIGIDLFIGFPCYFNRGIGTTMVRKFVEQIARQGEIDLIILDPEVSNIRAIKCYEKCQFKKVKTIQQGANWLMEYQVT